MTRPLRRPLFRTDAGFTLVELMVAITLMAVLMALSVKLASVVIDAYREQRTVLAVERAARASLDILSDAARNASAGVPTGDSQDAAGCTDVTGLKVENHDDGPDELTVIYASGGVVTSLRTTVTDGSSSFEVLDATGLSVGDQVLLTSGESGRLLPVSSIAPAGDQYEIGTVAAATACPGIDLPSAGFPAGTLVVRAKVARFYVEVGGDGVPTLMMDPDGDGPDAAEPLADGIEDLQIAVGVDVDGDGNLIEDGSTADEWFYNAAGDADPPAVTVTRWRALRLTVVARTLREHGEQTTGVRPAAEDHPAGTADVYRRRVLSAVIEIRNLEGSP